MFDNPLSALAGAPPEPQQPAQQGTPAPINETAAPQQPEPMKPGLAPAQSFENKRPSVWLNVVQGALTGLMSSGGSTSFAGGMAAGAKGVFDMEEQVKFRNERAALSASNAARQNAELARLKQEGRIAADEHQMKLVDFYAKQFGYVPAWVSDDTSDGAMAGLQQLNKSHEGGVPPVFTMHLGDAGERGKIVAFTTPPPDKQLEFVNYARAAEGVPKLNEAQWKGLGADKQEQYVHNANELWMPSVTEEKIPGLIARYRGLKDTLLQRGDTPPEFRTQVAEKFDSAISMLQAIQSDHVTRKLDYKRKETEIVERTKAKYKTSDEPNRNIVPTGATGENVLANLSPALRESVKGLADYKVDPSSFPTRVMKGSSQLDRATAIGMAKALDPSFDETQYKSRAAVRKDFTSGKAAFNIRSLNTAIGHLDAFAKAGAELQNGSVQLWNRIANSTLNATGDPRVAKFLAAADAVSGEAATIFKGTSGTDQEIKAWREHLSSASSPEQIKATTEQLIELMASRLEALDGQYQSGMNKPRDFRFLNDKSAAILEKLGATHMLELDRAGARMEQGGQGQQSSFSVTDPRGTVHNFRSQQEADAFKNAMAAAQQKAGR
jgi:hypothetical protein